jgi:hypothetical protein
LADEELKALRDFESELENARTELLRASPEEYALAKRNFDARSRQRTRTHFERRQVQRSSFRVARKVIEREALTP